MVARSQWRHWKQGIESWPARGTRKQLADLENRFGKNIRTIWLDVTNEAQAKRAVEAARDAFGGLDVLVNNAGYGNVSPVEDTPIQEFCGQIEANLSDQQWKQLSVSTDYSA